MLELEPTRCIQIKGKDNNLLTNVYDIEVPRVNDEVVLNIKGNHVYFTVKHVRWLMYDYKLSYNNVILIVEKSNVQTDSVGS